MSVWFKRDCALADKPAIQAVALSHGPGAVTVLEELFALAKIARAGGIVQTNWTLLCARAFVKKPTARKIVTRLEEEGLIVVEGIDKDMLTIRLNDWDEWNPTDPTNVERQRKYRARNALRNGKRNGENRDVTALEVEREVETPPLPPKGDIPVPPVGNRQRDKDRFLEDCQVYADRLFPDLGFDGGELVKEAIGFLGEMVDPDSLRSLVRQWRPVELEAVA